MSEVADKAFWEEKNVAFSKATPACDMLHPELVKPELGASLTETQYLGFNVPEANVHGLCYIWHHPNLKVVTGGAFAWQGIKKHNFECELFDFVTYMKDDCLKNDLWDYKLENSYHVTTIEPLKKHRIRYDDPHRKNSIDITLEAIMPPMVLSSGMHLEQAMKTSGQVTLRGKSYPVNGFTVRDRSWGQKRSEAHTFCPPLAWMTGIVDESFIFGCTAFDTPELTPDNYPGLAVPGGHNVMGGWVYQSGQLVPIVKARKVTRRNQHTQFPEFIDMELVDSSGKTYAIQGTITAAANWRTWHNFDSIICLTRWEYNGKVFYGDTQECHWSEFERLARAKAN